LTRRWLTHYNSFKKSENSAEAHQPQRKINLTRAG
jgi:hypothetical protein